MAKKPHPVRLFLARLVYWSIWGPAVAVAIPFHLFGMWTDFCSDRLFPRIANFVQPAWALVHSAARLCADPILGDLEP